ncbi:MAG: hypothetical protein US15_C0009G0013 [Candidatus Moranbacteria bacterium GW2011_GWF1_36_4]|nr:MAG: hypothetical protein US15_C0009G0013 [Candidatus Moranbacteria bacterium GW2011_GWF1_36_4]KKQ21901.1 MAG: hypothetical protein US37_C0006G0029 [Candidatus Moranbacteria bacterium GW2011_GWF2_37_11]KKQ47139.1 MAG: hypothetical protein US66_C0018G0014 [Candidatus Moranbacteria bacterium GW2011_GWD2_37_9]
MRDQREIAIPLFYLKFCLANGSIMNKCEIFGIMY